MSAELFSFFQSGRESRGLAGAILSGVVQPAAESLHERLQDVQHLASLGRAEHVAVAAPEDLDAPTVAAFGRSPR